MTARLLLLLALLLLPRASDAAGLPRIVASADNPVPKCVQPAALMDFVAERKLVTGSTISWLMNIRTPTGFRLKF
jgi:hypothetical protein